MTTHFSTIQLAQAGPDSQSIEGGVTVVEDGAYVTTGGQAYQVDQATYDGWKQFNLNCARCHGEDVLGTTIAPHLIVSLKPEGPVNTKEAFVQVVCAGRPAKGMPAWCSLGMDPATIEKIYAYVKARSDGKMSPGRPARKAEG